MSFWKLLVGIIGYILLVCVFCALVLGWDWLHESWQQHAEDTGFWFDAMIVHVIAFSPIWMIFVIMWIDRNIARAKFIDAMMKKEEHDRWREQHRPK